MQQQRLKWDARAPARFTTALHAASQSGTCLACCAAHLIQKPTSDAAAKTEREGHATCKDCNGLARCVANQTSEAVVLT